MSLGWSSCSEEPVPPPEKTLTEFIIGEQRRFPAATGGFTALVNDIRLACKRIAYRVGKGALAADADLAGTANQIFLRTNEWGGHLAGIVSTALEQPYRIPAEHPRGRYLLACHPLDGSGGLDANVPAGSIFSVLACPEGVAGDEERAFLQRGARQVCAGYAIYGPVTMLVLTFGRGVHGFTLDREIGEFIYTHPDLRVAEETCEFAINTSNARFWEPAVKRYVDECLAGGSGPRGKDFNMRWIASLVAEAHRILMRGGVFLYPRDERLQVRAGRVRLLSEANPIGMVIEHAGGRASTGYGPVLEVEPDALHQRIGLVFGAKREVERIEQYHRDFNERPYDAPLFGTRGLFRVEA
jgi:fructose-1,6-bisphosphatase I / sedoheptulose-1,7-bisphosphatase